MLQHKPKTYRLWRDVEAKLRIRAEMEGITPAKLLNVLLSQLLKDVELPTVEETVNEDLSNHDAF